MALPDYWKDLCPEPDPWAIAWAEAQKRNCGFYDHTPNDFADHDYAASIAANMPGNHDPFENGMPDYGFLDDFDDDIII